MGWFDTWLKGYQDLVELFSKFRSGFKPFQDTAIQIDGFGSEVFILEGMQATLSDPGIIGKVT